MKARLQLGSRALSGAFTLVELLVTVSIVVILTGLLMSALPRALDQMKTTYCANNLRQIGVAFSIYISEHDGEIPYNAAPMYYGGNGTWVEELAPYMGIRVPSSGYLGKIGDRPNPKFACPASTCKMMGGTRSDYAKNAQINGNVGYADIRDWRLSRITDPAIVIALADSELRTAGQCARDLAPWYSYGGYIVGRHRMKANVMYYDWHIESIFPSAIPSTAQDSIKPPWWPKRD